MTKETQTKLSPIEKNLRNILIVRLYQAGCSVGSISRIMNMHQSTVSRVTEKGYLARVELSEVVGI
jgi:IS30 family transposase